MRKASPELEAFIDETIKRGRAKGYHPTVFIGMRQSLGTVPAISKLVQSADLQSGFKRLHKLNLLEWTIEAAVEKFPEEFTKDDLACASFRLREARREGNAHRI
ncbi:hypothetical protein ACUN0C_15065 [Faunimonas sp. B44]|uniref:hypothetical protein n=1 Tax=Faunimonas sp. B44 TaxID=3461493 RepID=UPI004044A6BF